MTEPSKLKQAFASGKFVVSGEVGPPKGTNIDAACRSTLNC